MKLYSFCKSVELVGDWTPRRPFKELPNGVLRLFVSEAKMLYDELMERESIIKLVPAPEPKFPGHCIRVVEQDNPGWYSSMYVSFPFVRRERVLCSLWRILTLKDTISHKSSYGYDGRFRDLIMSRLIDGYEDEGRFVKPNNDVRDAFGLPPWTEPAFYAMREF